MDNNKTIKRTTVYFNQPILDMIKELKAKYGYTSDANTIAEAIRHYYFNTIQK